MHIRCFKPCVVVNEGKISADFSTQLADKTTVHKGKQAFCASSFCVMPLSRRLALSHTETAGGVRSIIVVLVEISMEKDTRFSIFSYYTETGIF